MAVTTDIFDDTLRIVFDGPGGATVKWRPVAGGGRDDLRIVWTRPDRRIAEEKVRLQFPQFVFECLIDDVPRRPEKCDRLIATERDGSVKTYELIDQGYHTEGDVDRRKWQCNCKLVLTQDG